jgi:hypothetical protein
MWRGKNVTTEYIMQKETAAVNDLHESIALTEEILDALEEQEESGEYEYGMNDHAYICGEIAWFNNFLRLLQEMGVKYERAC